MSSNPSLNQSSSSKSNWWLPIFLYVVAAIVMIFTGYLYYRENVNLAVERTKTQLETLNSIKQKDILNWFNERDKDVAFYQNNKHFLQEVSNFLTSQEKSTGNLEDFVHQTQVSHGYDVFILDSDSSLYFIAGIDSTRLSQFIIDSCLHGMRTGRKPFLDIYRRQNTDKLFYASMGPLLINKDNKPDAVLIFRTNVRDNFIHEVITENRYTQNVSYSLVRHESDTIILLNTERYTNLDMLTENIDNTRKNSLFFKAASGKEGVFTGENFAGEEIIASIRKVPGSKWFLVVHTDKATVEKPIEGRKWVIASYIFLVMFLFIMWHSRFVQKSKNRSLKEELRLNNELINNREILQTIIQSSPLPIIVLSRSNEILIWNNAATEIFGWSFVEVLKMPNPVFRPEHKTEFEQIIRSLSGHTGRYIFETRRERNDGRVIDLRCWAGNVIDPVTKGDNILLIFEDITDRKRTARELRQLNESLEQRVQERTLEVAELNKSLTERANQLEVLNSELESFTYSVSHDLKAPLRSIQGFTDIIFSDHEDELSEEVKRLLSIVRKNARRMDQLIKDLLDLSRVTRTSIKTKLLNMEEILNEIINNDFPYIKENTSVIMKSLEPAQGDPVLIQQVWNNLFSNAVKYSRKTENPVIEIGSNLDGSKVIYYVKDNGAGFNPEYAGKLFNTFQRLHTNDQFEGTGVGLAIVKRIIQRHGGEVWADGEENKGATFYFTLPV